MRYVVVAFLLWLCLQAAHGSHEIVQPHPSIDHTVEVPR